MPFFFLQVVRLVVEATPALAEDFDSGEYLSRRKFEVF